MLYRLSKDILYKRAIENGLKMSYNDFSEMLGPIEYVEVKKDAILRKEGEVDKLKEKKLEK